MITKIEYIVHPTGVRFYKLHVTDFVSGHIWCIAYKYNGCIISSFAPSFNECARVTKMTLGFVPSWTDCSNLTIAVSAKGCALPRSYSQFVEWLNSIRDSFKNI